jgi:hypothetical protein
MLVIPVSVPGTTWAEVEVVASTRAAQVERMNFMVGIEFLVWEGRKFLEESEFWNEEE